ncbi:hypothetical protein [Parageobacillus thermoglucosidasius]|jgi:hypothetical protein|uniref:hypothetical protein n=1 Tax=Parageobacillus thermoglucosidasius TaxID=1426 RepID=UPI001FCB3302|nr:hypothetical protein [Parageobacillus thermoglucosidasius]BDG30452.1 hypothetical protein PthBH41_01640 [Parageobacillus thermoglucosidasius]
MEKKKQVIFYGGKMIEVTVQKTVMGDYIGYANFPGDEAFGVHRNNDEDLAFRKAVEHLLMIKSNL